MVLVRSMPRIFFNANNDVIPTEFQSHHTPTGVNLLLCMIMQWHCLPSTYLILHLLYLDQNLY